MIWLFSVFLFCQEVPTEPKVQLQLESIGTMLVPGRAMPVRFTMVNATETEISLDEPVDYLAGLEIRDPQGRVLKAPGKLREVMRRHKLGKKGFVGREIDVSSLLSVPAEKEGLYVLRWHFQDMVSSEIQVYVIRQWQAILETTVGRLVVEFFPETAPKNVLNFLSLSRSGFYKNVPLTRVVPGYMIEVRKEDSEKKILSVPLEVGPRKHQRGSLSMSRGPGIDSATTEFYFTLGPAPQLDGKYTLFGHVVEGIDVLQAISSAESDHSPCAKCGQVLPANPTQHCRVHHNDRPKEDIVIRSIQLRSKDN